MHLIPTLISFLLLFAEVNASDAEHQATLIKVKGLAANVIATLSTPSTLTSSSRPSTYSTRASNTTQPTTNAAAPSTSPSRPPTIDAPPSTRRTSEIRDASTLNPPILPPNTVSPVAPSYRSIATSFTGVMVSPERLSQSVTAGFSVSVPATRDARYSSMLVPVAPLDSTVSAAISHRTVSMSFSGVVGSPERVTQSVTAGFSVSVPATRDARYSSMLVPVMPSSASVSVAISYRTVPTSFSGVVTNPERVSQSVTAGFSVSMFSNQDGGALSTRSSSSLPSPSSILQSSTHSQTRTPDPSPQPCRCDPSAAPGVYCGYCPAILSCPKSATSGCWANAYGCSDAGACTNHGILDLCYRSRPDGGIVGICPFYGGTGGIGGAEGTTVTVTTRMTAISTRETIITATKESTVTVKLTTVSTKELTVTATREVPVTTMTKATTTTTAAKQSASSGVIGGVLGLVSGVLDANGGVRFGGAPLIGVGGGRGMD
jgi:hypothetical protein